MSPASFCLIAKTAGGFFGVIADRVVLANKVGDDLALQNVDEDFFKTLKPLKP